MSEEDNTLEEKIATVALLNLVRLLAAELVAGEHRHDVEKLIQAMDQKLDATPLPNDIGADEARLGIARAKELLRPYVKQVRDQAKIARTKDSRPATLVSFKYLQ